MGVFPYGIGPKIGSLTIVLCGKLGHSKDSASDIALRDVLQPYLLIRPPAPFMRSCL